MGLFMNYVCGDYDRVVGVDFVVQNKNQGKEMKLSEDSKYLTSQCFIFHATFSSRKIPARPASVVLEFQLFNFS